jgi:hypothetical protein
VLGERGRDGLLDTEEVGEADGPTDDAAQHVAAVLVRGDDAVGDEEGHGAGVVGQQLERDVGLGVSAEASPGGHLGGGHQRAQLVGVEHIGGADGHREEALEAGAGVDVLGLERLERTVAQAEVLLEHEVPELHVAVLGGRVGRTTVGTDLRAEVPEQLRGGSARSGVAHLPEVVLVEALDALDREADLVDPQLYGLVVVDVARDPDAIAVEPEHLGGELPGPSDGIGLEVVAEAEVAEHLEERQVTGRPTDRVEVVVLATGSHALLDRLARAGR